MPDLSRLTPRIQDALRVEARKKMPDLRAQLESTVRSIIDIPYDAALDNGSIIDWQLVGDPARRAFERVTAEIAAGLLEVDNRNAHARIHTTNR